MPWRKTVPPKRLPWQRERLWFRENAYAKERLGAAIDRLGTDALIAALATDDLLNRKAAILQAPIRER